MSDKNDTDTIDPEPDPTEAKDPKGTPPPRTYTSEEFDQATIRARQVAERQATRKAREDLAAELGIDLDTAKALIEETRKRQEAEKSDAQKATEAAEAARREAETALAQARQESARARLTEALLRPQGEDAPGCRPDRLDAAITLGLPFVLDASGEEDPIAAAVARVRETVPEIFGVGSSSTTSDDPAPRVPSNLSAQRKLAGGKPAPSPVTPADKWQKFKERAAGRKLPRPGA